MHKIKVKNISVLVLSNTHGKHRELNIPSNIELIIHCGDICTDGDLKEIKDFFEWYSNLPIKHKVFVNGNHDLPFELNPMESEKLIPENVIWLNDEWINLGELKIGALSPNFYFFDLNFPNNLDILISHGPPLHILDGDIGSSQLRDFVLENKPKFHVFGHHHAGRGKTIYNGVTFLNSF